MINHNHKPNPPPLFLSSYTTKLDQIQYATLFQPNQKIDYKIDYKIQKNPSKKKLSQFSKKFIDPKLKGWFRRPQTLKLVIIFTYFFYLGQNIGAHKCVKSKRTMASEHHHVWRLYQLFGFYSFRLLWLRTYFNLLLNHTSINCSHHHFPVDFHYSLQF